LERGADQTQFTLANSFSLCSENKKGYHQISTEETMSDTEEPSEELIQAVAATMSCMNEDERRILAKHLHVTPEELDIMIENWKASRQ
jgi:hypothetical protein